LWQKLLRESSFFLLLLRFDRDMAEQVRARGCPHCGSALHYGRYRRKPRGGPPGLSPGYERRESLCCSADGCRKRVLPQSLRYFGRRLYLGPVFVLISAMIHGITEKKAAALQDLVGVSRRTLERWRAWWRHTFPQSGFWRAARGRFATPADPSCLPASLLGRLGQDGSPECAIAALRFLAPLSGGSGCPMDG
jgi:hypothetical protein